MVKQRMVGRMRRARGGVVRAGRADGRVERMDRELFGMISFLLRRRTLGAHTVLSHVASHRNKRWRGHMEM